MLRKLDWTDADVTRFPGVLWEDHLHEQAEAEVKTQVALTEAEVDAGFNKLMCTILNHYHEEQVWSVWSNKIRSASTYGSLVALGVNVAVFFLAIVVVEPWKRRRLVQTFEKRIEELSLENRDLLGQGMNNLVEYFEKQEQVLMQLIWSYENSMLQNKCDMAAPSILCWDQDIPAALFVSFQYRLKKRSHYH